jgi:shikimate dehydrogenase
MARATEYGKRAFNGAGMLLYQGIIAYELWTGRRISDELAMEVYEKMTEALRHRR